MKVLLINGSPHNNGCTFTALAEAAEQLEQNGIETKMIHIGVKPIGGCTGCYKCMELGKCAFNDDVVTSCLNEMETAAGLIIGSPVYFASANGNLISLLDRLFIVGSIRKLFAHKPGAAVVSARRAGTTVTLDVLYKYFTIAEMPVVSSSYWNMVHGNTPEEVRQDLEGMQTMRNLGNNMAWLLKSIEAGKKAGVVLPQSEKKVMTNFIR
jgi:multimeric flavodoxin WrbA